eukprot:3105532-Pleurochrysis_carterae.AAC.3
MSSGLCAARHRQLASPRRALACSQRLLTKLMRTHAFTVDEIKPIWLRTHGWMYSSQARIKMRISLPHR